MTTARALSLGFVGNVVTNPFGKVTGRLADLAQVACEHFPIGQIDQVLAGPAVRRHPHRASRSPLVLRRRPGRGCGCAGPDAGGTGLGPPRHCVRDDHPQHGAVRAGLVGGERPPRAAGRLGAHQRGVVRTRPRQRARQRYRRGGRAGQSRFRQRAARAQPLPLSDAVCPGRRGHVGRALRRRDRGPAASAPQGRGGRCRQHPLGRRRRRGRCRESRDR